MANVMLDLETMGTGPAAAIVSIGAVVFDSEAITERIKINVELRSSVAAGMTLDADTVMWWMQQADEARKSIETDAIQLADALRMFRGWLGCFPDPIVWGNGADFDNTVLTSAYRLFGSDPPWDFRNNRCYRTVKNIAPWVKTERAGVHHDALDDATFQALHLIRIMKELDISYFEMAA